MTDARAVSILNKVSHWWSFDGNLNDQKGTCNLTIGTVVAGYGAGKKGQMLLKNSRAAGTLPEPFQLTTNNALTIGGWVYYDGTDDARNLFGLTFNFGASNSAFGAGVNAAGAIRANGFIDGSTLYGAEAPGFTVKAYPVNVRVTDSKGSSVASPQTILIGGGPATPGFYFVTARFNGTIIEIYLNGVFVAASTPPMPTPTAVTVKNFQVGQQFGSVNTNCGLDEVFFCRSLLTPSEIDYLYNAGVGRSYAELQALAS